MHAGLVGQRPQRAVGIAVPDLDRRGVVERVRRERDAPVVDRGHAAHLQVGRGDGLAADEQAAGAVAVGAGHDRAVGQQPRDAGDDVDPHVVGVLEAGVGGTGGRIDAEHGDGPLVA